MRPQTLICLLFFVAGVVLFLIQLWFNCLSAEMFSKLMLTDALLFLVSFVIVFVMREEKSTKKLHEGEHHSLD